MDAFASRKRRRLSPGPDEEASGREESTELKLALLSSLHADIDQGVLLEVLLSSAGSVEEASRALEQQSSRKKPAAPGLQQQSSISHFMTPAPPPRGGSVSPKKRALTTRKGKTIHLFSPEDIAANTPCSIIHNFLPAEEANLLLQELLDEAQTFERQTFKLFDNVVQSPHTASFYVANLEEARRQRKDNPAEKPGKDVRLLPPLALLISFRVRKVVNTAIATRILTHYPNGEKLKHQSPHEWLPNAAFINCYSGPTESVGYHSDQLTYLGPHPTIGSLSLGVSREFRIRRILPQDSNNHSESGAISIHLPHNSLLIMHAEMQEEWKHSIHPATTVVPHPISGGKRINITYRHYRENFHPKFTPRCVCGIACVLRVVQRKKENWGRYFWMCHAGNVPGKEGCDFFQWAEFDDDGEPLWGKTES